MSGILAEEMVYLDESMFNQTTGWRLTAWAAIDCLARCTGNRTRGHVWSLLAEYTTGDYSHGVRLYEDIRNFGTGALAVAYVAQPSRHN